MALCSVVDKLEPFGETSCFNFQEILLKTR